MDPGGYFIVRVGLSIMLIAADVLLAVLNADQQPGRSKQNRQPAKRQSLCAQSPSTLSAVKQEPLPATGPCISAHHLPQTHATGGRPDLPLVGCAEAI